MSKRKFAMRPVLAVMALGVALTATIASGEENTATKVDGGSSAGSPSASSFAIGDTVALGDWQLVVHGITDPYISSNEFMGPKAGNRIVVVDTEVTNNGDKPEIVSSMMCFDLKDADNKSYNLTITDSTESTPDGEVAPGASRRGSIAYEIPEAATGLKLEFKCDLMNSGSAVVNLS